VYEHVNTNPGKEIAEPFFKTCPSKHNDNVTAELHKNGQK
jgi:hypothetical protein